MRVKQVMTRGVECVRPDDSIPAAAEHLREVGMGALPVCGDNNRLVGMITDQDVQTPAYAFGPELTARHISDVMRPSIYCFEDQDVGEVARLMKKNAVRRLSVLDHQMRLIGIVWLSDLAGDCHDEEVLENARAAVARLARQPR